MEQVKNYLFTGSQLIEILFKYQLVLIAFIKYMYNSELIFIICNINIYIDRKYRIKFFNINGLSGETLNSKLDISKYFLIFFIYLLNLFLLQQQPCLLKILIENICLNNLKFDANKNSFLNFSLVQSPLKGPLSRVRTKSRF